MSTRESFTVYVRVRPPDSETKQYAGGLTMQERRAAVARSYHDDPHDVVTLSSGALHGRRTTAQVQSRSSFVGLADGAPSDERYNIVTVQQVRMTVPSSSNFLPGEQQQQNNRRASSADNNNLRRQGAAAAAGTRTRRTSSAKVGPSRRNGNNNNNNKPVINATDSFILEQQQQQTNNTTTTNPVVRFARHHFEFDQCFSSNPSHPAYADQARVYTIAGKPAVEHALKGFNVTLFIYGQTGAGKTWTAFGNNAVFGNGAAPNKLQPFVPGHKGFEDRGLVFRVAEALCLKMSQIRRSNSTVRGKSRSVSAQLQHHQNHQLHNTYNHNSNSAAVSEEPEPRRPLASSSASALHNIHQFSSLSEAAAININNSSSTNVMTMTVSFFEIYCDKVWCLLDPREPLRVREHKVTGPFVEGLEEIPVTTVDDVYRIVERGTSNRHFAATLHNHQSSRSHALLLFNIHQRQRAVNSGIDGANASVFLSSKLYMVDLAGSERVSPHDEVETAHRSEAKYINSSLSVLGKVITALAQVPSLGGRIQQHQQQSRSGGGAGTATKKHVFVPYRDSVFTRLLRDSFGGNSKTIMIAAVSPEIKDLEETISTLRYASRARYIQNRPVVNSALQAEDRDRDAIIESLARRVEELEAQLTAAQTSATVAQLSAAASALAQGLQQQHEHAHLQQQQQQQQKTSVSSEPTTRAPSSVIAAAAAATASAAANSTVSVGAVRWGGGRAIQEQQQHQQPQQVRTAVSVAGTAPYAASFASCSMSQPPLSARSNGDFAMSQKAQQVQQQQQQQQVDVEHSAWYQQLLERSNQQQAMLERIEDRENMLLRILMSSSSDLESVFSPPQLMRGPVQTPGPVQLQQKKQQQLQALRANSNNNGNAQQQQQQPDKQLDFRFSDAVAVVGNEENNNSRSASNNAKTAHFAPAVLGDDELKRRNAKTLPSVLLQGGGLLMSHHPPPPPSPQEQHNHQHAQQQHQQQQVQFHTPARLASTTSTAADAAEAAEAKSPSVTPPPDATPLPPQGQKNGKTVVGAASTFVTGAVWPSQQQQQQQSNASGGMAGDRSLIVPGQRAAEYRSRAVMPQSSSATTALEQKRAALAARAEELRKRKAELASKWDEVARA